MNSEDIIGKKFNKLTVLEKTKEQNKAGIYLYKCRCDCSNITMATIYQLRHGYKKSCGCLRHMDLTGQKFGQLTVIKLAYIKKDSFWLCKCDCGKEKIVQGSNLKSGQTKSCGCLRLDSIKAEIKKRETAEGRISLVGQRFGSLTVLENKWDGVISKKWICQCDCGEPIEVSEEYLLNGSINSCGCQNRKNAKKNIKKYMGQVEGTSVSKIKSTKIYNSNTSGAKGVSYHKASGKWNAYIGFRGKLYNLGYYKKRRDAIKARQKAEEEVFGEFLKWYYETFPDKKKDSKNTPG